jgi:hypothetical protein
MTIPKLALLLRDAQVRPACNEMELHPHFQQPELFQFVVDQGIVPIGYSPIGSPGRPDRDRTPSDTVDVMDPVIQEIADRHRLHPAVVCIKWAGHGQVLVQMKASSICGSDIRAIYRAHLGKGAEGYQSGTIGGHEPCGQILEVGSDCREFKVGDRVILYHIAGCGLCEDCKAGYMISCHSELRQAYG